MIGKKALAVLQIGFILLLAGCGSSFDGKADSKPAYIGRLEVILDDVTWTDETLLGLTLAQWETAMGLSFEGDATYTVAESDYYTDRVNIRTELYNNELSTAIVGGFFLNAIEDANPEMPINTTSYNFGTNNKTILAGDFSQLTDDKLNEIEDLFLYYLFDFQSVLDEARNSELGHMAPEDFTRYQRMFEYFTDQLDIDMLLEINDSDYIQEQIHKAIIELINRGLTKDA